MKCYDLAINTKSDMIESYNNKGVLLLKLKKYDDAEDYLIKALNLAPNSMKIQFNLIHVWKEQKKYVKIQRLHRLFPSMRLWPVFFPCNVEGFCIFLC